MKLRDTVLKATEILKNNGVGTPGLDAEVLMEKILSKDRIFLILHPDYEVGEEESRLFFEAVGERAAGKPAAYIVGEKEFMGLPFYVSESVLIPRPDTEVVAEEAIRIIEVGGAFEHGVSGGESRKPEGAYGGVPKILDLCTGSGALAVSLAHYLKNAEVTATDISVEALEVAEKNAERNGTTVRFLQGDLFEPVPEGETFDLIISNPPYIPSEEIEKLEKNVKDYEPRLALDGGGSGLDFYRRIVPEAADYLKPGGALVLEIGFDQAEDLHKLGEGTGVYEDFAVLQDLAGLDRVVTMKKKG